MKRRRRRRIVKEKEHRTARYYVARGYPLTFVAEKVDVSRATIQVWCKGMFGRRRLHELKRKIMALSADQRKQLLEMVA